MKNPPLHIKQFACFYGIAMLGFIAWLFFQNILLHQFDPVLFVNKPDFSKQIILLTGLPQALIQNNSLAAAMDLIYVLSPLVFLIFVFKEPAQLPVVAILQVIFNFVYGLCLSMTTTLSVEGFAASVLVPLVFIARSETLYNWLFRIIRYAFVILFFSTAIWKIRAGGVFHIEQMSAILFMQHAGILSTDSDGVFVQIILFLINHPRISYGLYFLGFFTELIFILGLFSMRWDRLLCIAFLLFLLMDLLLMHINYFCWLPFAGLLFFSKHIPALQAAYSSDSHPNPAS